jgi:hypothetical protein
LIKLRPEIWQIKYWFHLIMIALIVLFMVNYFVEPMQIDLRTVIYSTLFIGVADIIVHTTLKLD